MTSSNWLGTVSTALQCVSCDREAPRLCLPPPSRHAGCWSACSCGVCHRGVVRVAQRIGIHIHHRGLAWQPYISLPYPHEGSQHCSTGAQGQAFLQAVVHARGERQIRPHLRVARERLPRARPRRCSAPLELQNRAPGMARGAEAGAAGVLGARMHAHARLVPLHAGVVAATAAASGYGFGNGGGAAASGCLRSR